MGLHKGQTRVGFRDYKIQIDATWNKATKVTGLAWLLFSPNGLTVHGGDDYGLANSARHAEAQVLLNTLTWLQQHHMYSVTIFMDCEDLILSL